MNHAQNIVKLIEQSRYRYDVYTVFSDAMAASALAISNSVDIRNRARREARYMEIVARYDKATVDTFPKILAETAMALEMDPRDVLGPVFHELQLHNKDRGQVFTPHELSLAMAKMTIGNGDEARQIIKQRGFVTAHEPAVGAGSTIIALAEAFKEQGINYQQQLHVTAVDIDERAAHMCYIQASLLHIPAAIYVGDSLKMEMRDVYFTPAHIFGGWSMRLRTRDAVDQAEALEAGTGVQAAEAVEETKPAPEFDLERGQFVQQDLFSMDQSQGRGISL